MAGSQEDAARIGAELFGKDYLCAESVLLAIARTRCVDSELVPGIASGFCSGVARTCDICGAVSGGILALGLCYGRSAPGEALDDLYALVRDFKQEFRRLHGSTNCRELLDVDLSTDAGKTAYREQNMYATCRGFVADACRILAALLDAYESDFSDSSASLDCSD